MLKNQILLTQKLNIGALKQNITYNSMEKQLKEAKLFLIQDSYEKSDAYKQFLSLFSYHDLQHSKLSHLYDQGVCKAFGLKTHKSVFEKFGKKMNLNGQVIHAVCSNAQLQFQ
ncbi:unnamed protein product [Paramecium sonneborni]|uniref:Uncharacterized protein n=1 Tax=Paramecium sonneborni TaxID=65129 RepID=A0A8S1N704_9CILI|nr:unnamed protein product [Paramecium sonneborni]